MKKMVVVFVLMLSMIFSIGISVCAYGEHNTISPYYLYSEAVSTIMNPTVRSVNVVTMQQLEGAISGYLSFGQSMLLVWPHLTGLVALMMVAFGGSYIGFMRQEIRN